MPVRLPVRPVLVRHRPAGQLTVNIDLIADRISLAGELSRQTAHHLLDAARTLSAVSHPQWIVEAAEIRSCDSTGLRAISACYRSALRHGATMSVVGADPGLRRALSTLRLDTHLMVADGGPEDFEADRNFPLAKVYDLAAALPPSPAPDMAVR